MMLAKYTSFTVDDNNKLRMMIRYVHTGRVWNGDR